MPPPPAARSHLYCKKAAPTTAQKASGSRGIDRRARFPHDAALFPPQSSAADAATGYSSCEAAATTIFHRDFFKMARASAFIPQQRHPERNPERELFPR
nr:unnamed protein product [Digitaria exilis]